MRNIIKYLTISATVGLTALGLMSNVCAEEITDLDIDESYNPQVIFRYSDGLGGDEFTRYYFDETPENMYFMYDEGEEIDTYRLYFCQGNKCYDANKNYNPGYLTDDPEDAMFINVSDGYNDYTGDTIPRQAIELQEYGFSFVSAPADTSEIEFFDYLPAESNDDPVDPGNNDPVNPTPSSDLSISSVFSNVTGIVTGIVTGALGVLTTMWANPIGQVTILSGLAATVIGFGLSIVTRKRKMK